MIIPNSDNAYIDDEKIYGYCLNSEHPIGKHKAKMFQYLLNLNQGNGFILINALKEAIKSNNTVFEKETQHGKYYLLDFEMENSQNKYTIHSSWIIKVDEDFPRLVSCYVL
ncbi:MAG: hypothetical protein NT007_04995 [Candidatus Kapabacteria bacterium]|nr:hypothetical protein [Candidatus Kapabacteria bacterium]